LERSNELVQGSEAFMVSVEYDGAEGSLATEVRERFA